MKNLVKYLIILIASLLSFNNAVFSKNLSLDSVIFEDVNGKVFKLSNLPGKIILIVNTASYCGFTKQYKELQELTNIYSISELSIVAIPSNDFGKQEPGTNSEIKDFCESKYGVTFPIMSKQKVIGKNKHEFYKWIEINYGVKKLPRWNFHKYLINSNGELLHSMSSHISPSSSQFLNNIETSLK